MTSFNICPGCNHHMTTNDQREAHLSTEDNCTKLVDKMKLLETFIQGKDQDVKPSAKGVIVHGTIDKKPFVKKSSQKSSNNAKQRLLFNEVAGYNMVKTAIADSDVNDMISPNMYIDNNLSMYTNDIGDSDIKTWLTMIGHNKNAISASDLEISVRLIIERLHMFVQTINCQTTPVYHCDLHLRNIRLQTDGVHVVNVFIIDFDDVRHQRCDSFRSSSRVFGLGRSFGDQVQNVSAFTHSTDLPTLTDWAFLNSIRNILYTCLAEHTAYTRTVKYPEKIKAAVDAVFANHIHVYDIETHLFPVLTAEFRLLTHTDQQDRIRHFVYNKLASRSAYEAHASGVRRYCETKQAS